MNLTKIPNPGFLFGRVGGGGGGSYGSYGKYESYLCIHDSLTRPFLQRTVYFHENNPDGIQNREHRSLNNQGEITHKVCKQELSFLYATHCHDLFYITVKCHDNIPKGI